MAVELLERPTRDPIVTGVHTDLIQIQTSEPTVCGMREKEWPIIYLLRAAYLRTESLAELLNINPVNTIEGRGLLKRTRQTESDIIRAVVQSPNLTSTQRAQNMRTLLGI